MKGNFQIIVIVIFIVAAIFGVMVFSGMIPLGQSSPTGSGGTVVLWGTATNETISPAIDEFNNTNKTFSIKYVQKFPETFDKELLEALAGGVGPDLFFLPDNLTYGYSNKIFTIPYQTYPLASFKNTFASAGEVFLTSKGVLAFPITIDPLVMYYNRSQLDANNIVYPPTYWDEFANIIPLLNKKDESKKIVKSAIALGQFVNVTYAKDIISALFMQAGNNIIIEKDGSFKSTLGESVGKVDLGTILKFYTDFADPLKDVYSWNRSFLSSSDSFSSDNLTFYFGYASEVKSLINKNPNQNFLAAPLPQIRNSTFKLTSGKVTGIAVSSFSKNFNTAFTAASLMATGPFASKYASALGVVPARRDLLSVKPTDAFYPVFYNSALYARSWLDPSSKDSDDIFRKMVDGVLSNSMTPESSVKDAGAKLNLLLNK